MFSSLFLYLGVFFLGVISGSFWVGAYYWWWPWLPLGVGFILRQRRFSRLFFLAVALFVFGFGRAAAVAPVDSFLSSYFSQESTWSFWVCADPEPAWDKQITTLCPLLPLSATTTVRDMVAANLPLYPRVYYGDILQIKCRLDKPSIFKDFNYAAYLAARGIGGICYWPEVISVKHESAGLLVYRRLFAFKHWALININAFLPEPEAGLAAALLLGYKKTLYPLEEINFQKSGLSHLVAISGGHISLFLNLLISLFVYCGLNKRRAIWPALGLAIIYVFLTGWQAAAWRSLLMGALMLYAWQRGRLAGAWPSLFLVAAIMLWQNPALWQRDLGFQLSFLALSGMIAFSPIFDRFFEPYYRSRWRRRYLKPLITAFNLSLAAQLAVWPLLALKSGGVSLIAPLANVLAFWVFGPLMLSLLIALALSGISGMIIFWIGPYLLLRYLLWLAHFCASWPGAYFETPGFNYQGAAVYYAGLLLFIWWYDWREQKLQKQYFNKKTP
mgnify:CR=1 FL=1